MVAVPAPETAYGYIEMESESQSEVAMTTQAIEENSHDVEAVVRSYFEDIPIMAEVAGCESHFRHTNEDGSILRGKVNRADVGVMQINLRYHELQAEKMGYDLHDLYGNLAYARHLYDEEGTRPWKASSACWTQTLAYR